MYCKKCGRKLADGDMFCPECGTKMIKMNNVDSVPQYNAATSDSFFDEYYGDRTISAERTYTGGNNYGSNYSQNFGGNNNQYDGYQSGFESRQNRGSQKTNRAAKKFIGIMIALIAAMLVGLLVFLIIDNSDWFKLAQAESAILDGKYDSGINKISKIDSDRAEAVRGFVDVLKLRDELKDLYDTNTLCDFSSEAYSKAKEFKEKLADYSKDYKPEKLTNKLSDLYSDYTSASADIAKLLYDSKVSQDFGTAQYSLWEYDKRKHGDNFTVDSLRTVKENTEKAYDNITKNLTDTDEYYDFAEKYSGKAEDALEEFKSNVSNQIAQDNSEIDSFGSQFGSKVIYYSTTDANHKAEVADGLAYADNEANIKLNAERLVASLDCAMLINAFDKQK